MTLPYYGGSGADPMIKDKNEDAGIRILSLDAGGPGTFSQLLVIKEYMSRLANDIGVDESDIYPADYFELMGGVGFGGLVSILLGHLRMNVDTAIDGLLSVAFAVFPPDGNEVVNQEVNTKALKGAIENLLQVNGIPLDTKMYDKAQQTGNCKVVIIAGTSANLTYPIFFRTYHPRGTSLNPTIVEAICATISTPSLFSPIKIGPRFREQNFVGGATGANNPTRELLKEAANVFGKDRRVAQIISIGSGGSCLIRLDKLLADLNVKQLAQDLASDCEMVAKELSTRLFSVDAYLRLNVEKGMENIKIQDWTCLGDIRTHTATYVETSAVTDTIDRSLRRLQEKVGTVTLGQINHSSSIKVTAKMPPAVSPCYVVRAREWDHMVRNLTDPMTTGRKVFPITGMGGCGKTQMVSYFLQEKGAMFTKVVFIDASSENSIKTDLHTWAQSLGETHEKDVWEDALRILENEPPDQLWLLILDNADDPALQLLQFFPKCNRGTIIITSRNRDVGYLSNTCHLEMGHMDREEALATLLKAARRQKLLSTEEVGSANMLMDELGCLAVALVQAGTYCHQLSSTVQGIFQPYSFTNYLSLFHSQRSSLMKKVTPATLDGYGRGVYTTLDLSYNAIPSPSRDLLHMVSYFHHSDISLSMLATAAAKGFKDLCICLRRPEEYEVILARLHSLLCANKKWNELYVHEMIQSLRSFSLVSTTNVDDLIFLHLHPLVQAWTRDKFSSASQDYYAMAAQILNSSCSKTHFQLSRHIVPHVDEILNASSDYNLHTNDKMAFAMFLVEWGHYHRAELLFLEVLHSVQDAGGKESRMALKITRWLSSAIHRQGRWKEAEMLRRKLLDQKRLISGAAHPGTILAAANLASTYHAQGRWNEAEKLKSEVLQKRRKSLGDQHPNTILATANLASTYHAQGRWSEAEKLKLEVLAQRRETLGKQHPRTIQAAANLASTYHAQGRWVEAEKLGLEVLEQQRMILGEQHPNTIQAAANLASTYHARSRWSDAEKLELEVLEKRRTILGEQHPSTIQAAANLASTYHAQCWWNKAEKLELEVLERRVAILGKLHPTTIQAAANLASTYHAQQRWSEAEKLELEVLERQRATLGAQHPSTIQAATYLASTYHAQCLWAEAEKLEMEVLEWRRKTLGGQHPRTLQAAATLVSTYHAQFRWIQAEKLALEVLEQQKAVLGDQHPSTTQAVANLAFTYHAQGRWSEAEKLKLEVLEQRKTILGMNHPSTISAASDLAETYSEQGKAEDAALLLSAAVESSVRVMGLQHPRTQTYMHRLEDVQKLIKS